MAAVPGIPSWVHHCYPVIKHSDGNRAGGGGRADVFILLVFKEGGWESWGSPVGKWMK